MTEDTQMKVWLSKWIWNQRGLFCSCFFV